MSKARRKRPLALPLVALAIFVPLLAACGGSGDSPRGPGTAAGGGAAGTGSDQYVKFARCMRQNGVPEWPDPIDGDKFRLPLRSDGRPVINPKSPQFIAASRKCQSLAPPEWKSGSRPNPVDQAQALKYARCMRENGLPEFPDPKDGALDPGDVNPNSPQFRNAQKACQKLAPAGVGG
jgi:hypothetical protein